MKFSAYALTRYFFLLTSAILAVFGVGSLLRITANPDRAILYGLYAVAMFGDAIVMLACVWFLNKRMRFAFQASIAVLALNSFLTIFDQFGWVDLLFVLLNAITLAVLIAARKELLPA